jgi:acyl-coenzyme A thioesterase PaaI-like protein
MATTTMSNPIQSLVEGKTNFIRAAWDKLRPLPGGKILFSKMVGRAAPYTGSIDGRVEELERGFARVSMRDRKSVRNHLDCVHAIALLNLAELTGNIALSYTLPDDARFIVAGMSIDYLKKARGTIYGVCRIPPVESSTRREYEVHVDLENISGEVVATSTLRTLVGPKKGS